MARLILPLLLSMLAGCAGYHNSRPIGAELHRQCADPRPQVCTLEYAPVCALLDKKQRKQYSNACKACANPAVVGYIAGPCPSGKVEY